MAAQPNSQLPLRTVTVTLNEGTRDRFFDELKKFADTYAFAIRIAPNHPDLKHFLIQMWRVDIKGIGSNVLEIDEFNISFYNNSNHPVGAEAVERVVVGLKQAIEKIPGATSSDSK